MNKNYFNNRNIALISILAAIGAILLFLNFPISFIAPSFYKIDFSELPVLIGGFMLGPLAAFLIEFIKIIINILIESGSSTMFIGELSNLFIGASFCVVAAYIYQKKKSLKGAIISLIVGGIISVIVAAILNYYVIIPAYVKFMHIPLDAIIDAGHKIFNIVDNKFTLILFCTIPFNIIKVLLNAILCLFLYKRISLLLKK